MKRILNYFAYAYSLSIILAAFLQVILIFFAIIVALTEVIRWLIL